jgi:sugar lactone lactonase YvrE
MTATLTKPIIVPQYANGVIQLYTPNPSSGAPTVDAKYTVDVTSILNTLFPEQGRIAAPNAVVLHGNDLFFTNSSSNSQAVFELPNYLDNPAAAIANAFVVTLDGNDYTGLAFDAAGHLYVAEGNYGDNQIVRYTLPTTTPGPGSAASDNYTAKTVIGNAGATSYFGDLAFDSGGNLWVADYQNSRVVAFDAANLGTTDTWHSITNAAGSLSVANTTSGLTGTTAHLFAEPEGVAFDGTGSSADLWVANNNDDGAGVLNTLTSLVEITKPLQSLILASADDTAVSASNIKANNNAFVYQVPNNADSSRPQFGGAAIDTSAGVLYANEEVGGDVRTYTLSSIAATPLNPSGSLLSMTTTNPGNGGLALVNGSLPCFREGTRLDGERGPVLVEVLQPGMRLRTAGGALREVIWIGHSRVDCQRHPRPLDVLPVRVAAGAMGEGLPLRDLWLSPDHALFVDAHLVPVRYLLNGTTIVQEAIGTEMNAGRVQYFHVELATHDILLAEGMPVESYLDSGNRASFTNGGGVTMLYPDFASRVWEAKGCAPLLVAGPQLNVIRQRVNFLAATRTGTELQAGKRAMHVA